jgi:hypothetical protein
LLFKPVELILKLKEAVSKVVNTLKFSQEGGQIDINAFDTKFFSKPVPGHIYTPRLRLNYIGDFL